jgi:hypothetical protein
MGREWDGNFSTAIYCMLFILRPDVAMKLFRARFNQREGTADSALAPNPVRRYASCDCLKAQYGGKPWSELSFHLEEQDTSGEAWKALLEYINRVAANGDDEFNPLAGIGPENWEAILTLPPSIAKLQSVKYLSFYGSHLVRIPPEIGEMSNLEELDVYYSHRLHWLPYEITRCPKLKRSRVSTRALYGNYKYHPPFPRLPMKRAELIPQCCSICRGPFTSRGPYQVWTYLRVATDAIPLLVNACSRACIETVPEAEKGYLPRPHQGGLGNKQSPTR